MTLHRPRNMNNSTNKYTKEEFLFLLNKMDKLDMELPSDDIEQFLDKELLNYRETKKKEKRGEILSTTILFVVFIFSLVYLYFTLNENRNLESRVSDMEWSDSLFHKFMKVSINDSTKRMTVTYRTRNNELVTYFDLVNENDSLKNEINNLKSDNSKYKIKLSLTEKNYPIKYYEKDGWISVKAPEIDSALLLLPYYRNKINYNPKDDFWVVTHPK